MSNKIIWIFQVLLALWFIMPAYMKLTTPKQKMIENKQLSPRGNPIFIRILGFSELLGIVGIIVPCLIGTLPVLTPITAACYGIVMVGAFVVEINRKDYKVLPFIVLAFIFSVLIAWFRFSEAG